MVRGARPAARTAAINARAKGSGAAVSSGFSGDSLVSSDRRTSVLPDFVTNANNSSSDGRRAPSTACWSGNWPA